MSLAEPMTGADPRPRPFWSDHIVTHIRRWGTDDRLVLEPGRNYSVGASRRCDLHVRDALGLVSRAHAVILHEKGSWVIRDLASKNGTWVDDLLATVTTLQPGTVLQVGEVKFIAETSCLIALHELLGRLIGWSVAEAVDLALLNIRDLVRMGVPLVLEGQEDMRSVVARIHRAALGERAPLHTYVDGDPAAAAARARGGVLCIPHVTREAIELFGSLLRGNHPESPRLVLCARTDDETRRFLGRGGALGVISIPLVSQRQGEMARLVNETALEISRSRNISLDSLTPYDLDHLLAVTFSSLTDLHRTLERLLLVRALGVTHAATLVGRTHSAMSQWLRSWMSG